MQCDGCSDYGPCNVMAAAATGLAMRWLQRLRALQCDGCSGYGPCNVKFSRYVKKGKQMYKNPNTIEKYKDIIYKEHPTSKKHPRMDISNRASQFAPFSALTGLEAEINETARETQSKIQLTEEKKDQLDWKFQILEEHVGKDLMFTFTFFKKDLKKAGGKYITITDTVSKINLNKGLLYLTSGKTVPIHTIVEIDSPIFKTFSLD